MAIYPGAKVRLIPKHNRVKMATAGPKRMNLHVAVSEASSLHGFFSGAQVCSHFYVAKDGTVEQYIDTKFKSIADFQGNSTTISVETQGGLKNANSEKWTDAQLESLAKLWAWAQSEHKLANRLAKDSIPGASSHGLSWHRLGVDPWRKSGGLLYSSSYGKICPGEGKISQIPLILALSEKKGGSTEKPKPESKPDVKPNTPKPSSPKPPVKDSYKNIDVDGVLGKETVKRLQEILKTPIDGLLSKQVKSQYNDNITSAEWVTPNRASGSTVVRALQKKLGVTQDGLFGPATIKALQKKLGTYQDGRISYPSPMVKKLQENLNANKLF